MEALLEQVTALRAAIGRMQATLERIEHGNDERLAHLERDVRRLHVWLVVAIAPLYVVMGLWLAAVMHA